MSFVVPDLVQTQFAVGQPACGHPDVSPWNIPPPETDGIAQIVVDTRRPRRRGRAVAVLAAAWLPAMLLGDVAAAAPGIGGPVSLHAPTVQTPTDPAEPGASPPAAPETTAPSSPPDATAARPPSQDEAAANLDAAWSALIDRKLRLTLGDEGTVGCQLLGLQGSSLVCGRLADGLVFTLERSRVTHVYLQLDEPPEVPAAARRDDGPNFDGTGMIVSGIIATSIGGALAIATVGMAAYCNSYSYSGPYGTYSRGLCPYYTIPMGVLSAAGLGAGIPLIVMGKKRKKAAAARAEKVAITASAGKTKHGVAGSVTLRF